MRFLINPVKQIFAGLQIYLTSSDCLNCLGPLHGSMHMHEYYNWTA